MRKRQVYYFSLCARNGAVKKLGDSLQFSLNSVFYKINDFGNEFRDNLPLFQTPV
jgi:hypothetical protein